MASKWGQNRVCLSCGLRYPDFRTGLTFAHVKRIVMSIGIPDDTSTWKYARRNGVLGHWHQLKLMMWEQHLGECNDALCMSINTKLARVAV